MKKIIISLAVIVSIIIVGYVLKDIDVNESIANDERFIEIYCNYGCDVFYDKETKVQYIFRKIGYGAGLTVLVDKDGKPLLYDK